jgi:hypothetical protein
MNIKYVIILEVLAYGTASLRSITDRKIWFLDIPAGQSHGRQLDASPVFLYDYRISVFGYSSTTASIRSPKMRLIIRGKKSGTLLLEKGGNERERAAHGELVVGSLQRLSRRGHQCGDVVYVYIETTTYCSDVQALIVVTRYTDVFTAGRRYVGCP